ncbi:MAG: glycoside hydrolase family 104 protein [Natronospirillum sp.]
MSDTQNTVQQWRAPFTASGTAAKHPLSLMKALGNASGGFYPVGKNGLLHAGVHFDQETANHLNQHDVRAIADGEVIAWRQDTQDVITHFEAQEKTFSRNFVLLRHKLQAPAIDGAPPELTFYSLYMHLKSWESCQNGRDPLPHWQIRSSYQVKPDDSVLGLRVRAEARGGIIGLLPQGCIVELHPLQGSETANGWRRLKAVNDGQILAYTPPGNTLPEGTLGWVFAGELDHDNDNIYRVGTKAKDKEDALLGGKGLNLRTTNNTNNIIGQIPKGVRFTLGEAAGSYRPVTGFETGDDQPRLPRSYLEGSVHKDYVNALDPKPLALDQIHVPKQPISIRAGELIGYVGQNQNLNDPTSTPLMHLEVFTQDDLPDFIEQSRSWADQLPEAHQTLLKITHDSKLRPFKRFHAPAQLTETEIPASIELLLNRHQLNQLPASHQHQDAAGQQWWLLEDCLPEPDTNRTGSTFNPSHDGVTGHWKISRNRNMRTALPPEPPEKYDDAAKLLLKTEVLLGRLSDPAQPGKLGDDSYTFHKYRILNGPENQIGKEGWMAFDSRYFSQIEPAMDFDANGYWVCEGELTPLSPWHWDGYTCLEETRPPLEHLLSQLHVHRETPLSQLQHLLQSSSWLGITLSNAQRMLPVGLGVNTLHQLFEHSHQLKHYLPKLDSAEPGELQSHLLALLDKNEDGLLNPEEIQQTRQKLWRQQQLASIAVKMESEWKWSANKWNALDGLANHTRNSPNPNWSAQKERIEQLCWWDAVAAKTELKTDGLMWYLHPINLYRSFGSRAPDIAVARVRAYMRMIRVGEGTVGEEGYERLFGGASFIRDHGKTFDNHPQIVIETPRIASSAAGAYQIMGYTWNDDRMERYRTRYGITTFTPYDQDVFCLILLKYKQSRRDPRGYPIKRIAEGEVEWVTEHVYSWEWASLPPGKYGQPNKSMEEVLRIFDDYLEQEIRGVTDLHIENHVIKSFIGG